MMIIRFHQFLKVVLLACLFSCNDPEGEQDTSALGTGRSFIRSSLDGEFKAAEKLLLHDTQNHQLFDSYKKYYNRLPEEKKKNYKAASYKIDKYLDENDSTTIITYSNSYMNKPMDIKLVRRNNIWKVDFKYTYAGNIFSE